ASAAGGKRGCGTLEYLPAPLSLYSCSFDETRSEGMLTTIPDVLVTTEWVAQHATDAGVRVVEVDVDTTAYEQGHVPGAFAWNWTTELCDTLVRDIVTKEKLEALLGRSGISNN